MNQEALGLTKEQMDGVLDMHHKELDPVQKELETANANLKVANEKVETQKTTINGLKEDLKKFDGVDVTALNEKIEQLENDIQTKDTEHAQQLADRDFQDRLKESIASAKGKNAKAITALLDLETLKASKNQKEDIAAALKALTEAEAFTFTTLAALENISRTNGTIENATRLLDTLLAEYVYGKDNAVNEVAKLKVQLGIE